MSELRELLERVEQAIRTAHNDDPTKPLTDLRKRHVERLETLYDCAALLRSLIAERSP